MTQGARLTDEDLGWAARFYSAETAWGAAARELLTLRAEVDKWRDLRNTAVKYGDRVTAENIALRAKVAEQEAELAAAREVVGRWRSEDFACGIYAGCHCYEVGSDDPCASCAVVEWIERYDETTGGGDRQSDG